MNRPFYGFAGIPSAVAFAAVALFLWTNAVGAQVTVDQSLSIEDYVNEVLLGEGVSATNISFIGSTEQIGYMTGGTDVGFPIEGGLVLSSGNAADAFCAQQGCLNCQGETPQTRTCWRLRTACRHSLVKPFR